MTLKVWIDGACEPVLNNLSSYGLIIEREIKEGYGIDPAGWELTNEPLLKEGKIIGSGSAMSNNVAEYSALIAFLEWYLKTGKLSSLGILDYESALIHSDSNLLVNQMNGSWKVKNGIYVNHYIKARNLINNHGLQQKLIFKWISREENTEADRLSKEAIIQWQNTNRTKTNEA
jgi:ribonuclease HI